MRTKPSIASWSCRQARSLRSGCHVSGEPSWKSGQSLPQQLSSKSMSSSSDVSACCGAWEWKDLRARKSQMGFQAPRPSIAKISKGWEGMERGEGGKAALDGRSEPAHGGDGGRRSSGRLHCKSSAGLGLCAPSWLCCVLVPCARHPCGPGQPTHDSRPERQRLPGRHQLCRGWLLQGSLNRRSPCRCRFSSCAPRPWHGSCPPARGSRRVPRGRGRHYNGASGVPRRTERRAGA